MIWRCPWSWVGHMMTLIPDSKSDVWQTRLGVLPAQMTLAASSAQSFCHLCWQLLVFSASWAHSFCQLLPAQLIFADRSWQQFWGVGGQAGGSWCQLSWYLLSLSPQSLCNSDSAVDETYRPALCEGKEEPGCQSTGWDENKLEYGLFSVNLLDEMRISWNMGCFLPKPGSGWTYRIGDGHLSGI